MSKIEKEIITRKTAENLKEELHVLKSVELPKIAKELQAAREHGDLRENAEYNEARTQQSSKEGRVKEIIKILENHVLREDVEVIFDGTIKQNVRVQYRELRGNNNIFDIVLVGQYEADPIRKAKVSVRSPLGRSLLGRTKGEQVYIKGEIEVPYKVEILDVIDTSIPRK